MCDDSDFLNKNVFIRNMMLMMDLEINRSIHQTILV